MKVLLAGGTGHTGERVARRLMQRGHTVRVLTRKPAEHVVVVGLRRAGAEITSGDFTQRWTLWQALEGCDALVNCAHVRWAPVCVQACAQVDVRRYVQMSSARRHSQHADDPTVGEVIAGETAIVQSNLVYTIVRPTMIFGGRRDANLTRLVAWFRKHRWFPLFGGGGRLVQPIYVEDLVTFIADCLEREADAARRAFDVAGPEAITYRQFLRETSRAARRRNPWLVPVPLGPMAWAAGLMPEAVQRRTLSRHQIARMAEDRSADISEARAALGFAPITFREAISRKARGEAEVEFLYPMKAE